MTNKIIEAAREAELLDHRDTVGTVPGCYAKALERFYAIARAEALEDAAKVAEAQHEEDRPSDYAYAIRKLKEQQRV